MMESSQEIARLCESWWGKLADSTKVDQHRFAQQLLELLGWRNLTPLETKAISAQQLHLSYVLRGSSQTPVAVHFVMPGLIEPPSSLVERGLDFCETTRILVRETRVLKVNYVFITDLYRSYLYDAGTDELLLHADTPTEFRREIVEVLTRSNVERGSLEEVRRQPRSYVARQLRVWCQHWCEAVAREARTTEDAASVVIDRLLVLRFLFDHDILKRTGWRLRQRFAELVARAFRADTRGCGRQLTGLFHDICFDWKAELFAPVPALDAALEKDGIAAPLLKEFVLLSNTKFSIATILESFNYGQAAEKARVRMVPDADEDRERYLAKQSVAAIDNARIKLDVTDEGYRAIFHWLDKLVALCDRLEVVFDSQARHTRPGHEEMDLFAWSEMDAKRPQALGDKLHHAVERGLTIYYSSPRQLRTARLMLYLHIINHYYQTKQRFTHFPSMTGAFEERPRVLDADRKWIYGPGPDLEDREE